MKLNKVIAVMVVAFNLSILTMETDNIKSEITLPNEIIINILKLTNRATLEHIIELVSNPNLRLRLSQNKNDWAEVNLLETSEAFLDIHRSKTKDDLDLESVNKVADNVLLNLCKLLKVDLSEIPDLNLVKLKNKDQPINPEGQTLTVLLPEIKVKKLEKSLREAWLCKILGIPILPINLNSQQLKKSIDLN